jgi:hypothetical protein
MYAAITRKLEDGDFSAIKTSGLSDVWSVFQKIVNDDTKGNEPFVICGTCQKIFKHDKCSSPSNLKKHVCYKKYKRESETSSVSTDNADPTLTSTQKQICVSISDDIRKRVAEYCVRYVTADLRSFATVQGDGFKELARCLVETGVTLGTKKFHVHDILPSPTTVSRQLEKYHAKEREIFVGQLRPFIEKGEVKRYDENIVIIFFMYTVLT